MAQHNDMHARLEGLGLLGAAAREWGLDFLSHGRPGGWGEIRSMDDLDWYLEGTGLSPRQILVAGVNSHAYGGGTFDPGAPMFGGGPDCLVSISVDRLADYVGEALNGGDDDEFIEWCVGEGLVDDEWVARMSGGAGRDCK